VEAESKDIGPRVLTLVTAAAMCAAVYMAFVFAPTEETMGDVQRIFYFHVASAWAGMAAFLVVFIAGIGYLRSHRMKWDMLALSSAEIGVVFITMALVTGSLWARPTWNTWWTWDPRLTTAAILWVIYVVYLMLRGAVEEPVQRARLASVFGIIGFIDVPIVFMAVRWWRTIHPVIFRSQGFDLTGRMFVAFMFCLAAFTLLYATLLWQRYRLAVIRSEAAALRQHLEELETTG
jgi:heme exporter protein C